MRSRENLCRLLVITAALLAASWAYAQGVPALPAPGREHRDCNSCHADHGSADPSALLKKSGDEVCAGCHTRGSAQADIPPRPRLTQPPEAAGSQHLWAGEARWKRLWPARSRARFSGSCAACHEPHMTGWTGDGPARTLAPRAYDPLGQPLPGKPAAAANLCFGCHGSPLRSFEGFETARVGGVFGDQARSSHRIGSRGRPDLPSLRGMPLRAALDCTSCHGGTSEYGLKGPHASRFPKLLSAAYETRPGMPESPDAYDLCYRCHNRTSLLENDSFPFHREHITGLFDALPDPLADQRRLARGLPPKFRPSAPASQTGRIERPSVGMALPSSCASCHDPHGSADNLALVRFDRVQVQPNREGRLAFLSAGRGTGSCDLQCHGHDHVDAAY